MNMNLTAHIAAKTLGANLSVESLRKSVAEAVVSGERAERLSSAVNTLSAAEGRAHFWARMANAAEWIANNEPKSDADLKVALTEVAMDLLLGGADDTWSGRNNDVKRAYFDGVRDAAGSLRHL